MSDLNWNNVIQSMVEAKNHYRARSDQMGGNSEMLIIAGLLEAFATAIQAGLPETGVKRGE